MRLYSSTALIIFSVVLASAPVAASAEVITYKFEGVVTSDTYFGPADSSLVGYFSYRDDLPVYLALPDSTSYGYPNYTHPSGVYFQIYYEDTSVFSTDTHARIQIYNDYGLDNTDIQAFDGFIISGTHLHSPGITIPSAVNAMIYLRDSDHSVFDSRDLPPELPAITEFEYAWVLPNSFNTAITSLTRINNGDLNGDGFVGIEDLNAVLTNWNQDVTLGNRLSGDSSNDGFVGIEDLNTVLGNWNAGTPPNDSANIPEPGTLSLVLLAFAAARQPRPAGTH